MNIPAVVTFAGARDSYQVPLALNAENLLDCLITDMYLPVDRSKFLRMVSTRIANNLTKKRYREGLDSRRVKILPAALGATIGASIYRRSIGQINRFKDAQLGRATRARAIQQRCAIFTYSYYARHAFAPPWDDLPYRFLLQVHPHTLGARKLLQEELERTPQAAASLRQEYELLLSDTQYDEFAQETENANGWVVASSFTAHMLAQEGIPREKIHVVPYGVELSQFAARTAPPNPSEPFTIIFIGQLIQRKGLADLLEAIRLLKTKSIRLLLCGRGFVDKTLLDYYSDIQHELHIGLNYSELLNLLRASDVFVFPSLLEGFAHVLLESMACGVPIIASTNTAAGDLIEDGKEGFIVPIRNPQVIAERLEWAIQHRKQLGEMGTEAAKRAQLFTWAHFRSRICTVYQTMLISTHETDVR